jgi:hypothetical protein
MNITRTSTQWRMRQAAALFACLLAACGLAACDPFAPVAGSDFKECRYDLERLPNYRQLSGGERLQVIHQCMERKGLRATEKCVAAGAQGKPHCEYEPAR